MPHLTSFLLSIMTMNLYVAELYFFSCFTGYLGYTSGFSLTCMVFFVSVVGDCLVLVSKQI